MKKTQILPKNKPDLSVQADLNTIITQGLSRLAWFHNGRYLIKRTPPLNMISEKKKRVRE